MTRRTRRILTTHLVLAAFVSAIACGDDDDENCTKCCVCSNDGAPVDYRPEPASDCSSCRQQCQALADREFLGQEFDHAREIECGD